ncbi:MAG: helix-turn-helix domain-containing protein [Chloroflexota bacterium]|jgi:AraC-like DNA-binding protein
MVDEPIPRRTAPQVIVHDDVDAYRAALSSWDMHAVPLGRGTFRLSWVVRELPDVSLVRYATSTSIREHYIKEPGSTAFVLVSTGATEPFRVRGQQLGRGTLTMLQPGAEYEVLGPAGGEALEVYVPDELVARLGLDRWLDPDVVNVRPDAHLAARLGSRVGSLVIEGRELAVHPAAERAAVLETLAATLDSVDPSAAPAPTVRLHQLYRRAIASVEADPDSMLTVVELAAHLGVTTRTLRYAFRYALGISPYQYMLRRRLTMVREALLDTSRAERTVLDLLLAHGITHQGEFAGQYRRLFGETPSQTRAAALGRRRDRPRPSGGWPHLVRAAR